MTRHILRKAALIYDFFLQRYGFKHDRTFAVIRQSNREVQTQRTQPMLATIQPTLTTTEMVLAAPDMPPLPMRLPRRMRLLCRMRLACRMLLPCRMRPFRMN